MIYKDYQTDLNSNSEEITKQFIVSSKYIEKVHINDEEVNSLIKNYNGYNILETLSKAKKFWCEIKYNILNVLYWRALLPAHWNYTVHHSMLLRNLFINTHEDLDELSYKLNRKMPYEITSFSIHKIILKYEYICKNEFEILCRILEFKNIQFSLRKIVLLVCSCTDALRIMSLLEEWRNIEYIYLRLYEREITYDVKKALIDEAKHKLIKKIRVIPNFIISIL